MLYLLGQIAVFLLVALVVGAALAWIFIGGPLRRREAEARAALSRADGRASDAERGRRDAQKAGRPIHNRRGVPGHVQRCSRGHQYVVRPPTTPRSSAAP
ncbi:MAG: hypothetical protein ACQSGP_24710, partial [Frankia sp.]